MICIAPRKPTTESIGIDGTRSAYFRLIKSDNMPKAKPVSLHPLTFHEALKAIIKVNPDRVGITPKRRTKRNKQLRRRANIIDYLCGTSC